MKNHKGAKMKIPYNQRTFDDLVLLRTDDMRSIAERMRIRISKLNENSSILDIINFTKEMEEDLKELKVNVEGIKQRFEMLDRLKRVLKQNPRNGVIESAIESVERNYAIKLIEIANEQIKKYD